MADVARGVTSTILFGKESSYATGGTANKDIGLVQSFTINPDSNIEERFGAGQAAAVYVKGGLVNVKGSVELELQHGRPLEWAIFGGTTTHAATSADYVHTMVWSNTSCSLAAEVSWTDPDVKTTYTGLQFGTSTLSCTVDGILKMRGDLVGKTMATTTTATAAVVNTGAPLGGFEAGLSMGGSSPSYVQSWEVTCNRNAKAIFGVGDRKAAYGATHLANVTWKATIGMENTTQINRLLGGTSISATEPASFTNIFSATNGVTIGSGLRALSMTMTGCQVKDFSVNLTKGDFTLYDISGSGIIGATTFTDQVATGNW